MNELMSKLRSADEIFSGICDELKDSGRINWVNFSSSECVVVNQAIHIARKELLDHLIEHSKTSLRSPGFISTELLISHLQDLK